MAAGGGMVYWKKWIRLRDAKKHTIKAFWWFKCDLISQWIPKFYLCDESNPINPQCGKISANFYISPPHPPHPQFYPQKWWKFNTVPGWPKKLHLKRPARGGGTHYVRVVGRLRGIDPPFSRHWEKISILDPPFSRCLRKISILDPLF